MLPGRAQGAFVSGDSAIFRAGRLSRVAWGDLISAGFLFARCDDYIGKLLCGVAYMAIQRIAPARPVAAAPARVLIPLCLN